MYRIFSWVGGKAPADELKYLNQEISKSPTFKKYWNQHLGNSEIKKYLDHQHLGNIETNI